MSAEPTLPGRAPRPLLAALLLLAAALALLPAPPLAAQESKPRVALVIGNGAYPHAVLSTPAEDARKVAEVLRGGSFDVVAVEDGDRAAMERAVESFSGKLAPGGVALVFYAGHTVQSRGHNFLLPVDAVPRSNGDLGRGALDLDRLLDALIVSRQASALVLLDAGRSNPWQAGIGPGTGLAPFQTPKTIAIASTVAPGRVSGEGRIAVAEWLKAIQTPGLDMAQALTRTRDAVARVSRRRQALWLSSPPPPGLVIVVPGEARVAQASRSVSAPAEPAGTSQPDNYEIAFWESIRSSQNPAEFRAYLNSYPNGRFAPLARAREQSLAARSPASGAAPAAAPIPVAAPESVRDCEDCPELVRIAAGRFEMGSNEMFEFEKPVHAVTIGKAFYLGRREVTFAEWDACVDQGGCSYRPNDRGLGRGARPVTDVHWNDANAYIAWLSAKTGLRYRLPTEAEWEYAARAGSTSSYPWGGAVDRDKANCQGCTSQPQRQAVETGRYPANAFGLFDMAGNAAEWVADCWSENYRSAPGDGSAVVRAGCRERVLRGGSFNNDPRYLRSAARFKYEADVRFYTNGFRVARDP